MEQRKARPLGWGKRGLVIKTEGRRSGQRNKKDGARWREERRETLRGEAKKGSEDKGGGS